MLQVDMCGDCAMVTESLFGAESEDRSAVLRAAPQIIPDIPGRIQHKQIKTDPER